MQNQSFYVLYHDVHFIVDPSLLYNSSKKFKELVDKSSNIQSIHLKINYDEFTIRNVNNFLKICQNQPTDVQDSELPEICLIARMFKADNVYNSGINYIQNKINPNFYIPDNKFDETQGIQYLQLESNDEISPIHHADLNELEFDESSESEKEHPDTQSETSEKSIKNKEHITACYQIIEDAQLLKLHRFYLMKDNKIIYMAKIKNNSILIGEGDDFHIRDNKYVNTAKITRYRNGYNIVSTNDQEFKIEYLYWSDGSYSLKVSFNHQVNQLNWRPKKTKKLTRFKGGYNHVPIQSKKNTILQNSSNLSTFIVRRMSKKLFEAECNQAVNPLIVFAIALSQIVGPPV